MPTLLALDDSKEILLLRSALFGAAGFKVIACDDPLKALKILALHDVALVVTDYDMPGMDGVRFSEYARKRGFAGPIILSSDSLQIPDQAEQWVDQIIGKAAPPTALVHAAKSCLKTSSFMSHLSTGMTDEVAVPCAA